MLLQPLCADPCVYVTFYLRLGMLDSACKSVGNLWRTFADLSPLWRGTAIGRVGLLVVKEGINEEEEGSRVSGSEPEQNGSLLVKKIYR